MKFTYTHKNKGKREQLEFHSLGEARQEAIDDFESGNYTPCHIADEDGNQIIGHAELREYLRNQA